MKIRDWSRRFASRWAQSRDGGVAMMFAAALPVLLLLTLGAVDITRASTVRTNLQDALDAASLAAARSSYTTDVDINRVGLAALRANLQAYPEVALGSATFHLTTDNVVIADASVNVKTLVASIVLPPYGKILDDTIPVGSHSEVLRSSKNVEVALVLDTTGSMGGDRITDLISAANELVGIVVQDVQTPFYSKIALVPYSMGVNVGTHAAATRGAVTGPTPITAASWYTVAKTVSGATRANPVVITSSNHGFATGDRVYISGVGGMSQINNKAFTVTAINAGSYSIGVDGRNYNGFSGSGTARKCTVSDCSLVVTSPSHGLQDGERVRIADVLGLKNSNNQSLVNGRYFTVGNRTQDSFSIGANAAAYNAYQSGGSASCLVAGCQWFYFTNAYGNPTIHEISTCVSERIGADAYNDRSPAGAPVGRNYPPASGNACVSEPIMPLTSDKTALRSQINDLRAAGSTAGQIGIAWGWYMISPNFAHLWPTSSQPGSYADSSVMKVVVLMTDGEFNTPYCNGVIARDAGSGSGSASTHNSCNATNGNPFTQAATLCANMKSAGVIVYTVGFDISSGTDSTPNTVDTAKEVMETCATDADHIFLPDTGTELKQAFAAIGREIANLRISR